MRLWTQLVDAAVQDVVRHLSSVTAVATSDPNLGSITATLSTTAVVLVAEDRASAGRCGNYVCPNACRDPTAKPKGTGDEEPALASGWFCTASCEATTDTRLVAAWTVYDDPRLYAAVTALYPLVKSAVEAEASGVGIRVVDHSDNTRLLPMGERSTENPPTAVTPAPAPSSAEVSELLGVPAFGAAASLSRTSQPLRRCPSVQALNLLWTCVTQRTQLRLRRALVSQSSGDTLAVLQPLLGRIRAAPKEEVEVKDRPGPLHDAVVDPYGRRDLFLDALLTESKRAALLLRVPPGFRPLRNCIQNLVTTMDFPIPVDLGGSPEAVLLLYVVFALVASLVDRKVARYLSGKDEEVEEFFSAMHVSGLHRDRLVLACFT